MATSLVPTLTANGGDGFVSTADTNSTLAWKVFDGSYTSPYRSSISPTLPSSIYVTFPTTYTIKSYTVHIGYSYVSYTNMKTWDFYGLVDGTYVLLHSGENPNSTATVADITGEFSPTTVSGIKITCKTRYGSNSWGIDELEIFESLGKILIKDGTFLKYIDSGSLVTACNTTDDNTTIESAFSDSGMENLDSWSNSLMSQVETQPPYIAVYKEN